MKTIPLQVDDLKVILAVQEVELKQKNDAADALIQIVQVETQKVSAEKAAGKVYSTYMLYLRYSVNIPLILLWSL
jgi:hypothetical protein